MPLSLGLTAVSDCRNPFGVPLTLERFAEPFKDKDRQGLLLGGALETPSSEGRTALKNARMRAKWIRYHSDLPFEPSDAALGRTQCAAIDFFSFAYQHFADSDRRFPLAGHNKCLGMAVVPGTRLALIALSQDKEPSKDIPLRRDLLRLINDVNTLTSRWVFELVRVPNKGEYIVLRTLQSRTDHTPPSGEVTPHTRCVEVALMVGLCKAGRFRQFAPKETAITAYCGTLWSFRTGDDQVQNFPGTCRNRKYVSRESIAVPIGDTKEGWLDIWDPCEGHCVKFGDAMRAFSVAGGPETSFLGPRGEWQPPSSPKN